MHVDAIAGLNCHTNRYLTSSGNFLKSTVTVTGNDVLSMYPSSRNSASTTPTEAVTEPHPRHPIPGVIFAYNESLQKQKCVIYFNHKNILFLIIIYGTSLILIYVF